MCKNLIQFTLFSVIVIYFISCSSSDEDKYSLITKEERKSIEDFCKCTEPIQPLLERFLNYTHDTTNLKNIKSDSAYIRSMYDSLKFIFSEFESCADKVNNFLDQKKTNERKGNQLIAYFKKYYPKCGQLMFGEKIKDAVKIK